MLAKATTEVRADCAVVTLGGEIDIACADEVATALTAAADHRTVVVDLREVEFLGSTGINLLVGAYNTVRANGGRLRLVYAGGPVAKVLRITGLVEVLPPHDSVDDAVRAC